MTGPKSEVPAGILNQLAVLECRFLLHNLGGLPLDEVMSMNTEAMVRKAVAERPQMFLQGNLDGAAFARFQDLAPFLMEVRAYIEGTRKTQPKRAQITEANVAGQPGASPVKETVVNEQGTPVAAAAAPTPPPAAEPEKKSGVPRLNFGGLPGGGLLNKAPVEATAKPEPAKPEPVAPVAPPTPPVSEPAEAPLAPGLVTRLSDLQARLIELTRVVMDNQVAANGALAMALTDSEARLSKKLEVLEILLLVIINKGIMPPEGPFFDSAKDLIKALQS